MKLASFMLGSMSLMIQQFVDKYQQEDLTQTLNEVEMDRGLPRVVTYDFIVVGGGSAGCVIAGRLSENFNVLLLEAGGRPVPQTYNPYLNNYVNSHPSINYFFKSIPQTNFTMEDGGIVESVPGKMLGVKFGIYLQGSGSHNGNVYNRGSPHDYDNFANLTGDNSWTYENMLTHYKRMEHFGGILGFGQNLTGYYGSDGPLSVDIDTPKILKSWFRAAWELGYAIGDPNAFQVESFTPIVKTMKNGERHSSYTAFIKPLLNKRKSLRVLPYSEVDQVLINSDKTAYGVRYKRHGIPQIAHATKEVIISAGTFSSPLLLMKSGIGPKSILEKAAIPVNQDLPGVGQNLRDHAAVILGFKANNPDQNSLPRVQEQNVERELNRYQSSKKVGFFTRLDVGPQAFIVSPQAKAKGESHWPDIQLVFQQHPLLEDNNDQTLAIQVVVNRLESVGEIGLNTTAFLKGERDDTKLAIIDHRLFTRKHDTDILIEGIKIGLKIMEGTKQFQTMNVTYDHDPPEACKDLTPRSDEYWKCHIQQRAWSWLHVTGTCKMGKYSDPMSVVDSKLRVKGVKHLRVVDASVMPQPTNANTAAPTMAIAEKTSQEIFREYFDFEQIATTKKRVADFNFEAYP